MTDLSTIGLRELREGLDSGDYSSVELVQSSLDRIEKHANLNAFIEVTAESALEAAQEADKEIKAGEGKNKVLLGIPIALKDIILVKGVKNTCGSKILENFESPYNSTVTNKLHGAGAIVVGKTNMDEFAMGSSNENSFFGPVKNPWDRERVPGGSSGGSAVSVSAGLTPASLGTDTGGSIRQPASLCGIVGVKPTYGRVSRYGIVAFASSLDQVGPFGKSVRDVAIMTGVISGHDSNDSTSMDVEVPNFEDVLGKDVKGLRVGIPKEYFVEGLDPQVEKCVRDAIGQLEKLGMQLVEISLPHTDAAIPAYYILAPAEASSNLARYDGVRYGYRSENPESLFDLYCSSRAEGFGDEVKRRIMIGTYVLSTGYYDAYYLRAQKIRQLISKDFKDAFEDKCDVIACPTTPSGAFKIGEKAKDPVSMYLNDVFTGPVNLAGLPGMSLPCGFESSGMPVGLQLIAKPFDEETLFQVGHSFQQATDWHTKQPEGA